MLYHRSIKNIGEIKSSGSRVIGFLANFKKMIDKKEARRSLKEINEEIYKYSLIVNKSENKKEEEEKLWGRKRELVAQLNKTK